MLAENRLLPKKRNQYDQGKTKTKSQNKTTFSACFVPATVETKTTVVGLFVCLLLFCFIETKATTVETKTIVSLCCYENKCVLWLPLFFFIETHRSCNCFVCLFIYASINTKVRFVSFY